MPRYRPWLVGLFVAAWLAAPVAIPALIRAIFH